MKALRVIISILILLLAILRQIFPSIIKIPNFSFDMYSLILLIVAIIILAYKWLLLPFSLLKKVKSNIIIKIFVVLLCVCFILAKMLIKNLVFDNTSLYLLLIAVAVIILPDIKDFLLNIKRLKKGDFEIELGEKLNQFKEKVDKVEEKIEENPAPKASYSVEDESISNKLSIAASDPRGMLLVLAAEIEQRIRKLSVEAGIYNKQRHIPAVKLLLALEQQGVITKEIYPLFKDFWAIRNLVSHGHHYQYSDSQLFEIAELGLRLLSLLPNSVIKE